MVKLVSITELNDWHQLSLTGSKWVCAYPSVHLRMETDLVSEILFFLILYDGQVPEIRLYWGLGSLDTSHCVAGVSCSFERMQCLHLRKLMAPTLEDEGTILCSFAMSENTSPATQCHIPEDLSAQEICCGNLQSCTVLRVSHTIFTNLRNWI